MKEFLLHPVLFSTFAAWFSAQLLKALVAFVQKRERRAREIITNLLWTTGGMPSSHSAMVGGLTTAIALDLGLSDPLFISVAFFSLIVIRDAMGVRRATGLQASAINKIGKQLKKQGIVNFKPIKEVHGHTPMEVAAGAILGVVLASVVWALV